MLRTGGVFCEAQSLEGGRSVDQLEYAIDLPCASWLQVSRGNETLDGLPINRSSENDSLGLDLGVGETGFCADVDRKSSARNSFDVGRRCQSITVNLMLSERFAINADINGRVW